MSSDKQTLPPNSVRTEPLPKLNEFQKFVAVSTGHELPLFGRDIFTKPPSTFAPMDQIPVPSDYVLGPGDQIVIRAWGQVDINYRATIDRNGQIFVPNIGQITIAGVKFSQLTNVLRVEIGRIYKNFNVDVSLGKLRSLQILVVGQARRPGRYTISALSTFVNALFASGGPSEQGSLRTIEVHRGNRVVSTLDLYALLLRGDKTADLPLQDGDVIFIPPQGAQVAITGSVPVPAIYELKQGETLSTVIGYSGGLSTTAEGRRVMLERVDDHQTRTIRQVALDDAGRNLPMHDGDVVTVFPIQPQITNAVVLRGNVAIPGRYPWHEGMKISDLIPNRDVLLTRDYWLRLNAAAEASTKGQERLRNEITRIAPEINWQYAVIQRLNTDSLSSSLLPFNLEKAINHDPANDVTLLPQDVITIFSQADIQVPAEDQSKYIRLEGELAHAGVYKAEPGETLRHLVERVGGLAPEAYLYGSVLTRESVRKDQQQKLDRVSEQFSSDVERSASYLQTNITNPADAATLPGRIESQRRLAERFRQLKATGRVVLNITPNDHSLESLPELTLEDGDRLIVPFRPATVSVLGSVNLQADFIFRNNTRLSDYLRLAGGATQTGDKKRIYILRANGSVLASDSHSGLFSGSIKDEKIIAGDAIVVPERINKTTLIKNLMDYSQILAQFGIGAAAIKVLAQ